jgi:prevent-host-death family protein
MAGGERNEDGRMQLMARRRMMRTRVQTRSMDADAGWDALPAAEADGVVSRLLLDAVSGGQPLLLTRRGRPAAVLVDPDSWAELELLAADALLPAAG